MKLYVQHLFSLCPCARRSSHAHCSTYRRERNLNGRREDKKDKCYVNWWIGHLNDAKLLVILVKYSESSKIYLPHLFVAATYRLGVFAHAHIQMCAQRTEWKGRRMMQVSFKTCAINCAEKNNKNGRRQSGTDQPTKKRRGSAEQKNKYPKKERKTCFCSLFLV